MKVFVKFYAELNLGDDLFLKILLERYPDTTFVINARKEYKEIFKDYNNLEVYQAKATIVSRNIFYRAYRFLLGKVSLKKYKQLLNSNLKKAYESKFKESDVFLSIGGSIFMQPKILPAYSDIELYNLANMHFNNIFYLGCNFGPYIDEDYRKSYESIFQKATDVCFREEASLNMFPMSKNIRNKPDIVFSLDMSKESKVKNSVGFSVITARNGIDEDSYIKKYVDLIKFYQKNNHKIYLFSFCSKEGDNKTIELIVNRLTDVNNINKVFYDGNIDSFLKIYSSVDKMYCCRFHSMILSMLYGQKLVPIVYSKKMTNVLEEINYKGHSLKIEDFYLIDPKETDIQFSESMYNISNQIEKSHKQFTKLDEILNKIK